MRRNHDVIEEWAGADGGGPVARRAWGGADGRAGEKDGTAVGRSLTAAVPAGNCFSKRFLPNDFRTLT